MHKRRTKSREPGTATSGTGHQYRQRRSTVPRWHRVAHSQLSPIPPPSHEPTGVLRPAGKMQTSGTNWRVLGCYGSQPVLPVPESLSLVQHPTDFDPNRHRQLSPLQLAMPLKAANFLPPGGRGHQTRCLASKTVPMSTLAHPIPPNLLWRSDPKTSTFVIAQPQQRERRRGKACVLRFCVLLRLAPAVSE